jgi:antitoxin component of RelBE/YafQ-DinJ toxin-antitoxin module
MWKVWISNVNLFDLKELTLEGICKIILTQVANTGETPFDNMFKARS